MVSLAAELGLEPDEFAFHFSTDGGVEASELGIFLQRAATVARNEGAELRIIAVRSGSVAVVLKALKRIGRAARKEFDGAPVATTAAGVAILGPVVAAIVYAMSPHHSRPTPIAKAGAALVSECGVNQIQVVTINETHVVMDEHRAERIEELERRRRHRSRLPIPDVQQLIEHGRSGGLTGSVSHAAGELLFRPDGHRFYVPIEFASREAAEQVYPDAHYRIAGELLTHRGQPDVLIVHSALRL